MFMIVSIFYYAYEAIGKWLVDTLRNILHVNFLVFANCFMSIRVSNLNNHSISLDQYIYATSVVDKYLYDDTVNKSTNFYITTLASDMIFTKDDVPTSDVNLTFTT